MSLAGHPEIEYTAYGSEPVNRANHGSLRCVCIDNRIGTKIVCGTWILLSGAVEYEKFLQQVTAACHAGASGVAVGRAVWQEAILMSSGERTSFLQETGRERMERITSLCYALARPWTDLYDAQVLFDWYKTD